jgi:hypothetical protein
VGSLDEGGGEEGDEDKRDLESIIGSWRDCTIAWLVILKDILALARIESGCRLQSFQRFRPCNRFRRAMVESWEWGGCVGGLPADEHEEAV